MRRTRNPRYAPEFLERKLSPSGIIPPPADVYEYVPDSMVYSIQPPEVYTPENMYGQPGDPPPNLPEGPDDPAGPAYTPDYMSY